MAESILFSTVDKILGTVTSLAAEQFLLAWGLEADLNKLGTTLSGIKAVILDAEDQPSSNHRITFWLKQLKDVLYDAEDVLDDVAYESLRKQVLHTTTYGGFLNRRKVSHIFSSSNPITFRHHIGRKIKEINLRLDEIAAQKARLNLAERLDNGSLLLREREMTHSLVNSCHVVGREGDRDTIVEFLMNSCGGENDVSVISIVGIGGLGKTVVAKMVFNDPRIVGCFQQRLWVCLGDMKEFNVNQVLKKIVKDQSDPQQLQIALQNKLGNDKFLLVLDDMWDVSRDKWLELMSLLALGAEGSKIVVTTRLSSVASCVGTTPAHKLKGLPHKECVSLFKRVAFESEEKVDQNLMKIGDEIVKKCKGVPLAVRSIGSMLFSKSDESEWLLVRDSDIWQIEENQNGIVQILKFSYDHLPSHLKQCFVYCSLFPEDYYFKDVSLISFWMAHGLLQYSPQRNQLPENVGKQYIKELLSKGFFQDLSTVEGDIWRFKMHDLVRELACLLGHEEFATTTGNGNGKGIPKNIRHVYCENEQEISAYSYKVMRTVILNSGDAEESNKFVEACISKFECLRVLWLAHSNLIEFPSCVDNVKHLRSLDLSGCKKLNRLPRSFCKLHNLEYLSLLGCSELEKIPKYIGELVKLRHLWITSKQKCFSENGFECLTSLQFLWFEECENLEFLLQGKQLQLTSLRVLVVRKCNGLKSMFGPGSGGVKYKLPALEVVDMRECEKLILNTADGKPDKVSRFLQVPRLRSLKMRRLKMVQYFPDWVQGSGNTLQHLEIVSCTNLCDPREWLTNFTSLQRLEIRNCPMIALPEEMSRLAALEELVLAGRNFTQYKNPNGMRNNCPKISHVPNIIIY